MLIYDENFVPSKLLLLLIVGQRGVEENSLTSFISLVSLSSLSTLLPSPASRRVTSLIKRYFASVEAISREEELVTRDAAHFSLKRVSWIIFSRRGIAAILFQEMERLTYRWCNQSRFEWWLIWFIYFC